MNTRSIIIAAFLAFVVGCKDNSIDADSWSRSTEDGIHYSYSRVIIDQSVHPVFVIGRQSDDNHRYAADWVSSGDGFTLSGVKLLADRSPALYYSDDGAVKKVAITQSGAWFPLFRYSGPSLEELEVILNEAIQVTQNK